MSSQQETADQQETIDTDKELKQISRTTITPSEIASSEQSAETISRIPTMEDSATMEKEVSSERSTPPDIDDVPLQLSFKRRSTSSIASKATKKLFKEDDGKPDSKS